MVIVKPYSGPCPWFLRLPEAPYAFRLTPHGF